VIRAFAIASVSAALLCAQAPSDASGKHLYGAYCASCHGTAGKGDGPVAKALRAAPTDLTLLSKRHGGKFPGAEITKELKSPYQAPHGSAIMPVWGPIFSAMSPKDDALAALRIHNIVEYMETLQVK
jgi:mono/diheme cytochrome c family protein